MKKVWACVLMMVVGFVCTLLNDNNVKAAEYSYEAGEVKEVYKKVEVLSFGYDYITKFSESSGYYNGVDVWDGESLKDKEFYSARSISIEIDHYDAFWGVTKDNDSVNIYKYNSVRNDFSSLFVERRNVTETYDLSDEGLYKIVYEFEGDDIYTKYVYITKDVHSFSLSSDENEYVYKDFSFTLELSDGYDLRNYKYYYKFGTLGEYTEFSAFTSEEMNGGPIYNISKEIVLDDVTKYASSLSKQFFVKVVDGDIVKAESSIQERFKIVDTIYALAYLVDEQGNNLRDKQYYKEEDVIRISIKFTADVTWKNLRFSLDGGNNYIEIEDAILTTDSLSLQSVVPDSEIVDGTIILSTLNAGNEAIVNVDGANMRLTVASYVDFSVDVTSPVISFTGDNIDSNPRSSYEVGISIEENNLDKVYYHVGECVNVVDGVCNDGDTFDFSQAMVSSDSEFVVKIDDSWGKFNNEKVAVYVKAVDKVGHVYIGVKYGYIVDNVIVDGEANIFEERDFSSEGNVGKQLVVKVESAYNVSEVEMYFNEDSEHPLECLYLEDEGTKKVYNCFEVANQYFKADISVVLIDLYGNSEVYKYENFKYSDIEEGTMSLGEYTLNKYNDKDYDGLINVYNRVFSSQSAVVFDSFVMGELDKFIWEQIGDASNKKKRLLFFKEDEELLIIDNVDDLLEFPATTDIFELIGGDEYKTCGLNSMKCNIDLYLEYSYKSKGAEQVRYIKIILVDNTNKFHISNFEEKRQLNINSEYVGYDYKYVNSFNAVISDVDNVVLHTSICYDSGDKNCVDVEDVDSSKIGTYYISSWYSYGGINSFAIKYEVSFKDLEAPVVRLVVSDVVKVELGSELTDHESYVNVSDNYDDNLTINYRYEPEFDSTKPGSYVITYWAVDSSGNVSNEVSRVIIVKGESRLVTYLIVGGCIVVTALCIFLGVWVEIKRSKK